MPPSYCVPKSLSSTSKSFHFPSPSPTPDLGSFAGSHLLNFMLYANETDDDDEEEGDEATDD
ncbi:hypothetical protein SLEP1_g12995 [Rubroshorea leprosula]|uniref:Uncharacterized protein n=1 Tax=Rubroshorea leprosula TaxID=152421 RepID=A0AAV5IEB9_9ROSI|nr:hypothetical protein SLEP1_g12995 [Rubroshorea leprosula]